jgi:hypothetical protein
MLILGVVFMSLASKDSRGKNLLTFNKAKIVWAVQGGGGQQFSNAFVTTGAPTLAFSVPGLRPFVLPLTLSNQATPLADQGGDAKG